MLLVYFAGMILVIIGAVMRIMHNHDGNNYLMPGLILQAAGMLGFIGLIFRKLK